MGRKPFSRNLLIDRLRLAKDPMPLPDDLAAETEPALPPVNRLSQCIPRVLSELAPADREDKLAFFGI